MALTKACQSRLENFKFRSAVAELTDEATEYEHDLVMALAVFGNPGWLLGGQMEVILHAAISTVMPEEDE